MKSFRKSILCCSVLVAVIAVAFAYARVPCKSILGFDRLSTESYIELHVTRFVEANNNSADSSVPEWVLETKSYILDREEKTILLDYFAHLSFFRSWSQVVHTEQPTPGVTREYVVHIQDYSDDDAFTTVEMQWACGYVSIFVDTADNRSYRSGYMLTGGNWERVFLRILFPGAFSD